MTGAHAPDFLWNLLALMHFMRLSSMKAAHAAVAWCRVQEIRVKPFVWLEWETTLPATQTTSENASNQCNNLSEH
jgi:hypothetical protein